MAQNSGFGDRLTDAMRRKGLTQKQLAGLLGVSQSAVSRMLSGRQVPKADRLEKMARELDVSSAYLLSGAAPQPTDAHVAQPSSGPEMSLEEFLASHGDDLTGREKRVLAGMRASLPSTPSSPSDCGTRQDWQALVRLLRAEHPSKL